LSSTYSLARAGRWLLDSGIQEPSGGVARYYRSDIGQNKAVSTEITGYTASALVYLFQITCDQRFLDGARKAAAFLVDHAWDSSLGTFPFEHPSPSGESRHQTYFFDCGIIIRSLAAVWRETQEARLLDVAHCAARGMVKDFHTGRDYHPILDLPAKEPLERTDQWSRTSGCYQLKAALAWFEVAELTGDDTLRAAYLEMVDYAVSVHNCFPEGAITAHRRMDRLHAYAYFLEGLTPVLDRADCVEAYRTALPEVSRHLRELAPSFVRSDVYAQLLRGRIYGARLVPVDLAAAAEEANTLAEFQAASPDIRIDGGFVFGRRDGEMSPHINPVSTAFALQALEMWRGYQAGNAPPCRRILI
jgi:hypothetical protein